MCLIHYISGAFTHQPEELTRKIGTKAGDLIQRAFDDIDPARLVDFVLKRALKLPGTERRLPAAIFMANTDLAG